MIPGMVLAMAPAGCAGRRAASPGAAGRSAAAQPTPAVTGPAASPQVAGIVTGMTLPDKVGQLLVPTVPGRAAADGGAGLIRRYHVGGVIYFGPNIGDAAQVAALSAGLQQAARSQPPHLPLLIGTDQEGGIVSRLAGVTTVFPGQMAAGAARDPALVRAQDQATGAVMRALGINLDYAPVADVNVEPANPVIGIRSFGAHPTLVSTMTAAAVLAGRLPPAGRLPVAIPAAAGGRGFGYGTGLPY
jgi:beta-N-acetylhexosaminidase